MKSKSEQKYCIYKIKGTSWMLQNSQIDKSQSSSFHSTLNHNPKKLISQNKKWKKNGNSLFETFSKKIESNIYFKLKRSNLKYNEFNFESLRKTESNVQLKRIPKNTDVGFTQRKRHFEASLFDLNKKQKDLEINVSKIEKLKEVTGIFEKKKCFYDKCIDDYFEKQNETFNKRINFLAKQKCKKSKIIFL